MAACSSSSRPARSTCCLARAKAPGRYSNSRKWKTCPNHRQPPAKCSAPQQNGFALIWGNFPKIQKQLGCPLTPEPDLFEGARQPFEGGTLLWSERGLGRGPTIYALLNDETFTRYKDPNSQDDDQRQVEARDPCPSHASLIEYDCI